MKNFKLQTADLAKTRTFPKVSIWKTYQDLKSEGKKSGYPLSITN